MDFLGFYGMDANWIWIIILPLAAWLIYYFIRKDKRARKTRSERVAKHEEQKRKENIENKNTPETEKK